MKIWAIADTHNRHNELPVPECDIVIHAGDFSNSNNWLENFREALSFLSWYESLEIPIKILVPGNHDIYAEKHPIKSELRGRGITLLIHEQTIIEHRGEQYIVFGSPYTPTFGKGWAYNKSRSKIGEYWSQIPEEIDILVTHGPPKGILDLCMSVDGGRIVQAGDRALRREVTERIKPGLHIFGHIHSTSQFHNYGCFIDTPITFINASCVVDGGGKMLHDGITGEV